MALTHWWKLNGDMHDDGIDSQELAFTGTGSFGDGPMGKYFYLAGRPGPMATGITFTSELTVCCWAKLNAASNRMMWSMINPAGGSDVAFFIAGTAYTINTGDGGGNPIRNGSTNVPVYTDSKWHHFAVTFSGTSPAKLYIDGSYAGCAKNYVNIAKENSRFEIGNSQYYWTNEYCWTDGIFDVRIYDESLSPTEIKDIARGCIVHLDFEDPYLEGTVNLGGASTSFSGYNFGQTYTPNKWNNIDGQITYYASGGYNNMPYVDYYVSTSSHTGGGIYHNRVKDIEIISGKTYTFSIYIRADYEYDEEQYCFNINRTTDNYYITTGRPVHITTNWQRHTHTFTATSAQAGLYGTCNVIYTCLGKPYHVQYSCFQIEENDHATPFTPTYREFPGENIINTEKPYKCNEGTWVGGWYFNGKNVTIDYTKATSDSNFTLNLKNGKTIKANTLYALSFDASGFLADGLTHNTFGIYDNPRITDCRTKQYHTIRNGHNQFLYNSGPNAKATVDGMEKQTTSGGTLTNFKLIEVAIPDCAGYCEVGNIVGTGILAGKGTLVDERVLPITGNPTGAYTFVDETNCGNYSLHTTGTISVDLGRDIAPTAFTITSWLKTKTTSTSTAAGPIVFTLSSKKSSSALSDIALTQYGGTNAYYNANGSASTASIPTNQWVFYAFVYNNGTAYEYINGQLSKTMSLTLNPNTFRFLTIGGNYIDGTPTASEANYGDLKMYMTALSQEDIASLYDRKCSISKINKIATKHFKETDLPNIIEKLNNFIAMKTCPSDYSVYAYQQTYSKLSWTDNGLRFYRTPNMEYTSNYGGIRLANIDNRMNLQKNHTYLIKWHGSGITCTSFETCWSNNYGWGGGGLSPTPTNVSTNGSVALDTYFDKEFFYEFTILDDVWKTCTASYSQFVEGTSYVSYCHFVMLGCAYSATNENGTDIYINNVRMYDITGLDKDKIKILKENTVSCGDIYEYTPFDNRSSTNARFGKNGTVIANEFIEN